jgi:hypothetical protein
MGMPGSAQHPMLREVIDFAADALGAHLKRFPQDSTNPNLFFQLLVPWVADAKSLSAEQQGQQILARDRILSTGFPSEEIVQRLVRLLADDRLLSECCVVPIALAFYLNKSLMPGLIALISDDYQREHLDTLYFQFESATYDQGSFRRVAYTHMFNLQTTVDGLPVNASSSLRTVSHDEIPILLNETTLGRSFLHPASAVTTSGG